MAMSWEKCKRTNTNFDWTWSRSGSYEEFFLDCCDGACCLYHFITAFTFFQTSMACLATSSFSTQQTAKNLKKQNTCNNKKINTDMKMFNLQSPSCLFPLKYIICMFLLKQICNFSKVTGNCYVTDNSYIQNIHTFKMFPYDGLSYN